VTDPTLTIRCDVCGRDTPSFVCLCEGGESVRLCPECHNASRAGAELRLRERLSPRGLFGVTLVDGAGI
jgi:hypothetical protein